ncbi:MAG: AAA family ATPase, partial [Bacillota bacterium]
YVGYDEGGQLTEKVRRRPYSVVLLDEVEKAHPEVFNILLQVLEDGRLTDSKGRTVDFRNTLIIMTSNAGAETIRRDTSVGFRLQDDQQQSSYEKMKDKVMDELRRVFRPEFLNRLDEIIVFHQLTEAEIGKIVDLMVAEVAERLREFQMELEVSTEAKALLAKEGYDPVYGARPLRRAIQRKIEDQLSEEILVGKIKPGSKVHVGVKDGQLSFSPME